MVTLRIATEKDADALARIYEYHVNNSTATFEYVAPDGKEFAHRIAHKLENYPFLVAEEDGVLAGYAYASEFRTYAAYAWSCEMTVYLDKNKVGKGIGKRLYTALEEILKLQNYAIVCAGVTATNKTSIAFHNSLGYTYAGKMDKIGFKHDMWLDVMWYTKILSSDPSPKQIIPFPGLDMEEVNNILSKN